MESQAPAESESLTAHWLLSPRLLVLVVAATVVKLWLATGRGRVALGNAIHDDRLFIEQAASLARGEWLGPYDQLTLAKGIGYPLWLAFCHELSLPSYLMEQLLYIAACLLFVKALAIDFPSPRLQAATYLALLFNPISTFYATLLFQRVAIYSSLSLLLFAGLIGLYSTGRTKRSVTERLRWALLTGFLLPIFWLTREEGVWALPAAGVLLVAAVLALYRNRDQAFRRHVALCLLPFLVLAAALLVLASLNYRKYDVFTVNEIKSRAFKKAYGALSRVEPERWQQYVPVPHEVRNRIYEVSPRFLELEEFLEGDIGAFWSKRGRRLLEEDAESDFVGAFFLWALRDAVEEAGHYKDAPSARRYYLSLAEEINRACDDGRLRCGRKRASLVPRIRSGHVRPLMNATVRSARHLATFEDSIPLRGRPSRGNRAKIALFAEISGDRLAPVEGEPVAAEGRSKPGSVESKVLVLTFISTAYGWLGVLFSIAALVCYVWAAALVPRVGLRPTFVISTAILASLLVLDLILCLISVTSFQGLRAKYLAPAHILVPPFVVYTVAGLQKVLDCRAKKATG